MWPERDHLLAALELGEEEDLVDQRAGVLDLGPRLVDQRVHVGARKRGRIEQREDPGERRPQLVRDRGGEARAELVEMSIVVKKKKKKNHHIVTILKPGQYRLRSMVGPWPRVLIVEDDNVIADGMARHLSRPALNPVVVGRGELGLARLRYENPDVCVLDLMLRSSTAGS